MVHWLASLGLWCASAHAGAPLDGLVVYLSAGHGYVAHQRGEGWQRPESHGILEDLWTARFATHELIPALERAGATVLTARERDPHRERIVVDDRDPGFHGTGELRDVHTLVTDEATWTLAAPHAGTWQLYARWRDDPTLGASAAYTVHTPTSTTRVTVDQRQHAGEWWPLARLELDAGDWVQVHLNGDGPMSADAIRLGGGTYTLQHKGGASRTVRAWEAAAIHHLEAEGAPEEVWAGGGGGMGGDAAARARWAAWSRSPETEAVYLAIHTDAGGGSGTTAFVRQRCSTCTGRTRASTRLADALRTSVVDTIRTALDPAWLDRGTRAARLAEVSDELNPDIPSVLLELGFHDHQSDAALLESDQFQRSAADALVAGLTRWRSGESRAAPPVATGIAWRDQLLTWDASNDPHLEKRPLWTVRARAGAARWVVLGSTSTTEWRLPEDTFEVEISAVEDGWKGRPTRSSRPEFTVVDSESGGHRPSR